MMERIRRLLKKAQELRPSSRSELRNLGREAAGALEGDEIGRFAESARAIAELVLAESDAPPVASHAALAIVMYLDQGRADLLRSEGVVLLMIALTALARSLAGRHPQDGGEPCKGKGEGGIGD